MKRPQFRRLKAKDFSPYVKGKMIGSPRTPVNSATKPLTPSKSPMKAKRLLKKSPNKVPKKVMKVVKKPRSKLITDYMVPKKPQKRPASRMSSKIAKKFDKEIDTAWVKYLHMVTFQKSFKCPPTSTWQGCFALYFIFCFKNYSMYICVLIYIHIYVFVCRDLCTCVEGK